MFPLPTATAPGGGNEEAGLVNGVHESGSGGNSGNKDALLGSDEALGGALLTPIPWLRGQQQGASSTSSSTSSSGGSGNGGSGSRSNREIKRESEEMIDGPNGAGRIETVTVVNGVLTTTVTPILPSNAPPHQEHIGMQTTEARLRGEGAVTQGELLRQEQEAGVVPVIHAAGQSGAGDAGGRGHPVQDSSMPHARGPDAIDAEDVGPQERPMGGGLDLDAAVGRTGRASMSPDMSRKDVDDVEMAEGKDAGDGDDFVLVDVDGKSEGDETGGDKQVPDAVDATTR